MDCIFHKPLKSLTSNTVSRYQCSKPIWKKKSVYRPIFDTLSSDSESQGRHERIFLGCISRHYAQAGRRIVCCAIWYIILSVRHHEISIAHLFGQSEVIRNGRWLNCVLVLRVNREIITPVFSDQALHLDLPYQPSSVVFIRVRPSPLSVGMLFLLTHRRLPTGTKSTDPSVGCLVVHLRGLSGPSPVFTADWYHHVDMVEFKNQLCFHIWSVRWVLILFDMLIRGYRTWCSYAAGLPRIFRSIFFPHMIIPSSNYELRSRQSSLQLSPTHSGVLSLISPSQLYGRSSGWGSCLWLCSILYLFCLNRLDGGLWRILVSCSSVVFTGWR